MATAFIDQGIVKLLETVVDDETNQVPVFGEIVPKNQRAPFITIQTITDVSLARHINGPTGLSQDLFQIDAYSNDRLESKRIARQIRLILDGYRGTVTIGADSVRIAGCSKQNGRSFVENDLDPKLYRASVDYLFTYKEDI